MRCARERKRSGLNIIEDKMASPCLKIGMFRTATRQVGEGGEGEVESECDASITET